MDATANDCDGVNFSTSGTNWVEHLDFDGTDSFRERFYVTADRGLRNRITDPYSYTDEQPELTEIVKELRAGIYQMRDWVPPKIAML